MKRGERRARHAGPEAKAKKPGAIGTAHRQMHIRVGGQAADVDAELAPLIEQLWKADCPTYMSCQEHPATGKVWLAFVDAAAVEQFLNAVAIHDTRTGSRWRRMNDWHFGCAGDRAGQVPRHDPGGGGDWEYHVAITDFAYNEAARRWRRRGSPDFSLGIWVLFPRSDLAAVTKRLRAFNGRRKP